MAATPAAAVNLRPRFHGQLMSVAEFAALPDDGCRYEYLQGVATMMAPTGGQHGALSAYLSYLLRTHISPNDFGHIFSSSTGYRLPNGDVRVPDVSVILSGRLPDGEAPVGFIEIPPDLAVEVISPSESYEDIQAKIDQLLNWGVQTIWIIEPSTRTITVHTATAVTRLTESDTLTGREGVPGFTCPVSQIFPH